MKKIFLIKHTTCYAICTQIEQYRFDENPLFRYHNHIMVNRAVTRKEAETLLELVRPNGNGDLCGGATLETIEL